MFLFKSEDACQKYPNEVPFFIQRNLFFSECMWIRVKHVDMMWSVRSKSSAGRVWAKRQASVSQELAVYQLSVSQVLAKCHSSINQVF